MKYSCINCDYHTDDRSNFYHHNKSKRHLKITEEKVNIRTKFTTLDNSLSTTDNLLSTTDNLLSTTDNELSTTTTIFENNLYICELCNHEYKYKSGLSKHKKKCKKIIVSSKKTQNELSELKKKIEEIEKEKELIKKMEILEKENELIKKFDSEKTEFMKIYINNTDKMMNNTSSLANTNAKTVHELSISALKYANKIYDNAPPLVPLNNFNINKLDYDNIDERKNLIEVLIYHVNMNTLHILLGDHIIQYYKKDDPKDQSFHTTDVSRLNYIVRKLIENLDDDRLSKWCYDKNGIEICQEIISPLIKKCVNILLDRQREILDNMEMNNDYSVKNSEIVKNIIEVVKSIDSKILEKNINKYIAPYFNIQKDN